jgi:hypothetical protein
VPAASVHTDGLDEIRRALARLAAAMPDTAGQAAVAAAAGVLTYARPRIPTRSGTAAGGLRIHSSGPSATLENTVIYFGFLDFGGAVGRHGTTIRRYITTGRYVYPGLAATDADRQTNLEQVYADAVTGAGLDVE